MDIVERQLHQNLNIDFNAFIDYNYFLSINTILIVKRGGGSITFLLLTLRLEGRMDGAKYRILQENLLWSLGRNLTI